MKKNSLEKKMNRKEWVSPIIRPLVRLGELTTPTSISASSPERHTFDIAELKKLLEKKQAEER